MAGIRITQLAPLGLPWRRYGSFAGKTEAAGVPGEVMVVIANTPGAISIRVLIDHPTTTRVLTNSPNKVVVTQNPADLPVKVII